MTRKPKPLPGASLYLVLALLDGEQHGYALMRRIRALPPEKGGRTPAAALTAFARNEDRTAALVAGYQTHLAKPVNPAELIAVVANLAGRTLTTPPKATQSGASGGI